MNKGEFIDRVMEETGLPDYGTAEEGAHIVLSLLSHRLTPDESRNVAAQLETDLRRLWNSDTWISNYLSITGEKQLRFRKKEQFFSLIRNEIDKRQLPVGAEQLASAVFRVLKEQVSRGEISDIADQLPEDLEAVWLSA